MSKITIIDVLNAHFPAGASAKVQRAMMDAYDAGMQIGAAKQKAETRSALISLWLAIDTDEATE